MIDDDAERRAVEGWRHRVREALAPTLAAAGIDDLGRMAGRGPLPDELRIGLAGASDAEIAELAERVVGGVEVIERAA